MPELCRNFSNKLYFDVLNCIFLNIICNNKSLICDCKSFGIYSASNFLLNYKVIF